MDVAGLLLTGGSSRRMGTDKASLTRPAGAGQPAETWAARAARLLRTVADPCLEVGPGISGMPACREVPPGAGPLAALSAGGLALRASGWPGPVVVVATDLPLLDTKTLAWLANHPAPGSVVPLTPDGATGGRAQPLCARWSAADLACAARLVAGGARSLHDLMAATSPTLADADGPDGPGSQFLADADTPDDARRLGLVVPAVTSPTAGYRGRGAP